MGGMKKCFKLTGRRSFCTWISVCSVDDGKFHQLSLLQLIFSLGLLLERTNKLISFQWLSCYSNLLVPTISELLQRHVATSLWPDSLCLQLWSERVNHLLSAPSWAFRGWHPPVTRETKCKSLVHVKKKHLGDFRWEFRDDKFRRVSS